MNAEMNEMDTKVLERCGAVFVDRDGTYYCELPAGHCKAPSMKHRFEGISWTQAGADRVAKELAAEAAKQVSPTPVGE